MFDQLTESNKNQQEAQGRRGYFVVTALIVGVLFLSGVVWSLYGKDLVLGNGDMELSVLVTPVAPTENAPRPPQPKRERQQTADPDVKQTTRQQNILRIDENPRAPTSISTAPSAGKARTNNYVIDPGPEKDAGTAGIIGPERPPAISGPPTEEKDDNDTGKYTPPPPPDKKETVVVTKKVERVSGGVVNGSATSLPKPMYSPAAIAMGASGLVNVQVTIDESGNVISAKAVTGHVLLRQSAERAAHSAKFKPTLLSNEPVKVTGVIVYNFSRN